MTEQLKWLIASLVVDVILIVVSFLATLNQILIGDLWGAAVSITLCFTGILGTVTDSLRIYDEIRDNGEGKPKR